MAVLFVGSRNFYEGLYYNTQDYIWIITEALIKQQNIFERICCRIMLGIKHGYMYLTWQTRAYIILLAKRRCASTSLSLQVTLRAHQDTVPSMLTDESTNSFVV